MGKGVDYRFWVNKHNECASSVLRLCEIKETVYADKDARQTAVKCNSALCVMGNAMQDIQSYFESDIRSAAELCFLIRNVDVIVSGVIDINNLLLGIGKNRTEKAIEKCFTDKNVINRFRTMRSLMLAHPVDTEYINEKGESETVYLEDIRPFNPVIDGFDEERKSDYIIRMCRPETDDSFFEPFSTEKEIVPVIETIINSLIRLTERIDDSIKSAEQDISNTPLVIDRSSMQVYIESLGRELAKRYPSAVEEVTYESGETVHNSIVHNCLLFFDARFIEETQKKYDLFLDYLRGELTKIEVDLQSMQFSEDKYFSLLHCVDFAPSMIYEKSKMEYLLYSNGSSYNDDSFSGNVAWGIKCFRSLVPYIAQYIPVDVSVSDKELYCQFIAANYLCNIEGEKNSD